MEIKALAAALMVWIGDNSSYDTRGLPLPDIVEMTPEELTAEAYRDNPEILPPDGVDERLFALYDFESGSAGTIYLLGPESDARLGTEQIPRDDPVYQERILHELVHHVQRLTGAYETFPCRNFGEKEAYFLGGSFLRQNHAEDPVPNRNFWAQIYSRC